MSDAVNHPSHYTQRNGVECIDVTEQFNFNRGNAIKYIWRAGDKDDELSDLRKAEWYIRREIERVERHPGNPMRDAVERSAQAYLNTCLDEQELFRRFRNRDETLRGAVREVAEEIGRKEESYATDN